MLLDFIIEQHTIDGELDREWLQGSAYDGLGYIWFGEYEKFLKKWKEDNEIKEAFAEVVGCVMNEVKVGTWLYNFYENLTIDKALEICDNIVIENNPWPTDYLYKGKSLCTHYGYPAEVSPRYERVAQMLNTVQGIVKSACDVAYMRSCEWLLEEREAVNC